MKSSTPTILAVAPGKKCFGIAVFTEGELTHFSVRQLQNKMVKNLLKYLIPALIRELIAVFHPKVIVVRTASQYQKASVILGPAVKIVEREARICKVRFAKVSLTEVKSALCNDRRATQKKVFQNLASVYPELRYLLNRPNKWQNDYYHNLFSAVSVGVVSLRSLSR